MDMKCRLCLFKIEWDESVNIFTPGKNNELISDTIMSFVPIELSPDDNLPQTICNVCIQKLDSIIEFRSLILNSDMELKIIKSQNKKIFQESENEISGASDDFKLEIDEVKLEIDETIREQNGEGNASREEARDKGNTPICNTKLYKCEECDLTFKIKSKYIAHNRRHTGDMPYHCDICNKGFPMNYLVVHHRRKHLNERPFKCDKCAKAFKFQGSLRMHKKIKHGIGAYKCDMCDKFFVQKALLQVHKQQHSGEKQKLYICEYCGKMCVSNVVSQHFLLKIPHQNTTDKLHTCEMCQKSFHQSNSLRIHLV